ncbi:hypothetical protein NQ314_016124 [Rhamnusium bicolor]|uniref:Uncharacterized protein n=1 Tax=Rhamnusium bicolor TaxID=1586634 RepID=A0AAV8WWN7_9CUCU|nr:hypothetical protein NQ314_016124 [Rhamnusium bicolor]
MDYSSSSDSSDDDLLKILENIDTVRDFHIRNDLFAEYSDDSEFREHFRFTKDTANHLAELINDDIQPITH